MSDELPPANLILQALHLIRKEQVATNERLDQAIGRIDQTNERLDQAIGRIDQTNARLDQTNEKLDALDRRVTVGFLETNTKLADLTLKVEVQGARIENLIMGQFGQDLRDLKARMLTVESKVGTLGAHESPAAYGPERK